ncbi:hypothetical protein KLQUCK414M2_25620 [Klebsiella quasipneumoniae subsp. similipneumoniae]
MAGAVRGIDALGARRPGETTKRIVIADLILLLGPGAVPVIGNTTAEIKPAPAVRQVLVYREGHAVFLPPQGVVAAAVFFLIDGVQRVVEVVITFRRVAIRRQHDAGLGIGEHAVKGGAIALPRVIMAIAFQPRMGDVKREGADPGVHPGAHQEGLIVVKAGDPGVAGQQVIDPVLPGRLIEHRLIAQPAVVHFTGGERVAGHARTQQLSNGGVRHAEHFHRAIRLFYRNLKIAAIAGWIDILQRKRPRRNGGLIDNVATLAHGDEGVALRHAANFRGIGAHAVREHIVIGGKINPTQTDGVEKFTIGKDLPTADNGVDLRDRPLEIGLVAVPVRFTLLLLPVQVTDMLQQPAVPRQAGIDAKVGAAVIRPADRRGVAVPGVGHPAKIKRGNAFVPELRADIVFQALIFIDLRHRNVQPQGGLDQVVFDVVFVAPGFEATAVAFLFAQLRIELFRRDAVLRQHRFGVADPKVTVFVARDAQIVAPFPFVVGVDVKGVSAFGNRAGREA